MEFTDAQRQVHEGIVKGLSNQRIADDLGVSEKTVKAHVTAILKKTSLNTRCEVIVEHYEELVRKLRCELLELTRATSEMMAVVRKEEASRNEQATG